MNYLKLTVILLFATIMGVNAQVAKTVAYQSNNQVKAKKIKKNSIAVLPSYFMLEEEFNEPNSLRVQSFVLDFLRRKKNKFKLSPISKRDVNAAIYNSKLNSNDIHNMDIQDLCRVLGTEYVLITEVSQVLEGVNEDYEFGVTTNNGNLAGAGQTNQRKKYITNTNVWMYNRHGKLVYENAVRPFSLRATLHFENEDWKAQVRTLIKKMPHYK